MVTQSIANLPLYFTSICCEHEQEEVFRPNGFDSDQIMLVLSGEGVFCCEGKRFSLKPGSAVYFENNVPHAYRGFSGAFKTAWVTFRGDALAGIRQHFGVRGYLVCSQADMENFLALLKELSVEYFGKHRETVMSTMIYRIIIEFFRSNATTEETAMDRAELYMIRNFSEKITLDDLVQITGFSKSKFCRMAKLRWNMTAFEKIMDMRLSHAQSLLKSNGKLKVSECARQSGFDDVSYFCLRYRRRYGSSPAFSRNELGEGDV